METYITILPEHMLLPLLVIPGIAFVIQTINLLLENPIWYRLKPDAIHAAILLGL